MSWAARRTRQSPKLSECNSTNLVQFGQCSLNSVVRFGSSHFKTYCSLWRPKVRGFEIRLSAANRRNVLVTEASSGHSNRIVFLWVFYLPLDKRRTYVLHYDQAARSATSAGLGSRSSCPGWLPVILTRCWIPASAERHGRSHRLMACYLYVPQLNHHSPSTHGFRLKPPPFPGVASYNTGCEPMPSRFDGSPGRLP